MYDRRYAVVAIAESLRRGYEVCVILNVGGTMADCPSGAQANSGSRAGGFDESREQGIGKALSA